MGGGSEIPHQISSSGDQRRRSRRTNLQVVEAQTDGRRNSSAALAVDGKALSSPTSTKQLTPPDDQDTAPSAKRRRQYSSDSVQETSAGSQNTGRRKQKSADAKQNFVGGKKIESHKMDQEKDGENCALNLVDKASALSSEVQNLPFFKNKNTIFLWEAIESERVFQKIPQKPHFKPLEDTTEDLREGLAIGYMVAFSDSVEKACRLGVNDPKSVVDDILETLAELERYGFEVRLVRERLIELLALKEKREKLLDEVTTFNNRIEEHSHRKARIEEELREVREKMRKLQEKISVAQSAKEKKEAEIAFLQAGVKEIEENIKNVASDFEGMVCSML